MPQLYHHLQYQDSFSLLIPKHAQHIAMSILALAPMVTAQDALIGVP